MRGLFSLDQELRATLAASGQKNANRSNQTPDPKETSRPWQSDIELVHQTMREVLRIVASLSGVELPGLAPGLQDNGAPPPRLDIKILKDRFRNELEGFSIKTTAELTKQAKEQTHAALDEIQNEVGGRIGQVAAELREKLQTGVQCENLLEPFVQQAAVRLERSLGQKVEQLLAEQKQSVQDRLQEALSSIQAQISTLEQAVQQIREQKADSRAQTSAAQLNDTLERSFSQKVERLFAEQKQLVQDRLQGALSSIQAQISTLGQTVQQIREQKTNSAVQPPAERPNAAVDDTKKKYESGASNQVNGLLEEAFLRIKASLKDFMETPKMQPGKNTLAGLEEPRNPILFDDADNESRVQQALDQLGRLGSKNTHPGG